MDLGLTRLEVPPGDRGRWAGFGYLDKTASLGLPCFLAHVPFFSAILHPRSQLPTHFLFACLLEPLVSSNLVNRFFPSLSLTFCFLPRPPCPHTIPFSIVQGPAYCTTVIETEVDLRVRSLERGERQRVGQAPLVGGFRSNQLPLRICLGPRHGTGGAPSSKLNDLSLS